MLEQIIKFDYWLFKLVNQDGSNSVFDALMPWITDLHKNAFFKIALPLGFCLFFIKKFSPKKGAIVFVGLLLSLGMSDFLGSQLFKKNFQRLRPGDNPQIENVIVRSPYGGFSFISNHSANMFNLATYTSMWVPPSAPFVYSFASIVAFSRVYNGVHYPTDVLVGGIWGSFIGWLFHLIISKYFKGKKDE